MNIGYIGDFVAAALSVAVVFAYHTFLRLRIRRDPSYTIQAVLNKGRAAWVDHMMKDKEGILAVQGREGDACLNL